MMTPQGERKYRCQFCGFIDDKPKSVKIHLSAEHRQRIVDEHWGCHCRPIDGDAV